ncbi:phytoalexin-deficient 4-2 protein, partial [Trifolium pratense]
MDLEDFIGSLKAHEAILQEKKPAKNKMIALESQVEENSKREMTCDGENSLQQDDEEEMAFLSRRIQKLMMRRNQIKNSFPPRRNETDSSQVKCYGCNQTGHYKKECPKLKQRRPPYTKSMMATWDDLEELPEEEEANVCLMTRTDLDEEYLLAVKKKPWYLDSGCSRHMTRDRHSFLSLEEKEGGTVTF